MEQHLKQFVVDQFPDTKTDLFAAFIERNCKLAKSTSYVGFMTPFVWMFLTSYEKLRELLVESKTITSLIHPEYHAFFDSAFVPICSWLNSDSRELTALPLVRVTRLIEPLFCLAQ